MDMIEVDAVSMRGDVSPFPKHDRAPNVAQKKADPTLTRGARKKRDRRGFFEAQSKG
jgi:hypothetical protein